MLMLQLDTHKYDINNYHEVKAIIEYKSDGKELY